MIAAFLLRAVFAGAGLWLAAHVVHGLYFDSVGSLMAAAVLLGLINASVRPVLVILTLPLTLITLGLFLLVINAGMLGLTSIFLRGFHLHGFGAAFLGAIIVSVTSWIGAMILSPKSVGRRRR
jgi:putative membrane protein